ncbi:MAG: hypothetical protein SWO11_15185 [Thermodesulfobacteriota bacterium]|nr:hypothetical protein [Thermodesulfobacteriota bacterium]
MKTHTSVISDLPEKIEMKTYASFSKKQVVSCKNLVRDIEEIIAETE